MSTKPVIELGTPRDWTILFLVPFLFALVALMTATLALLGGGPTIQGLNKALFFTVSLIVFIGFAVLLFRYTYKLDKNTNEISRAAEKQIKAILTEKYGLKLYRSTVSIDKSGFIRVTEHPIKGKNENDEEVLVSIQLTDGNTDVDAYSNGKEFERLGSAREPVRALRWRDVLRKIASV